MKCHFFEILRIPLSISSIAWLFLPTQLYEILCSQPSALARLPSWTSATFNLQVATSRVTITLLRHPNVKQITLQALILILRLFQGPGRLKSSATSRSKPSVPAWRKKRSQSRTWSRGFTTLCYGLSQYLSTYSSEKYIREVHGGYQRRTQSFWSQPLMPIR